MPGIMTTRARRLRKDMTDAEKRVWKHLRVLNQEGYHFRRQAPVGPYIADFIEHTRKLVIECDGDQHAQGSGPARDARRDAWFAAQDYAVIRVSNREALTNTDGVMITILEHCGVRVGANEPPSAPSPLVGEGWGEGGAAAAQNNSPNQIDLSGVPPLPVPPPQGGRGIERRSIAPQVGREAVPPSEVRASGRRRRGTGITP